MDEYIQIKKPLTRFLKIAHFINYPLIKYQKIPGDILGWPETAGTSTTQKFQEEIPKNLE